MLNHMGPDHRRGRRGLAAFAVVGVLGLAAWLAVDTAGRREPAHAMAPQRGGGGAAADAPAAFSQEVARAIAQGRRQEAEAMARGRGAGDPDAAAALARLVSDRGDYDQAETLLRAASRHARGGQAALELGLLLQFRGRRDEARAVLEPLASGPEGSDATAALRAGVASRALGLAHEANEWLLDAARLAPGDPAVHVARGELFLERHDRDEAASLFRQALERDARWAPAHLGLARALADENTPAAEAAARRAEEIDPGMADAPLFRAEAALRADRLDDGRAALDRALEINPRNPAAHALAAALAHLEGRAADAGASVEAALAVNPTYGDAFRVPAEQLASSGRFEDAVPLARRAAALEPWNTRALADLGMHLLRVGEEAEARPVLERAFKADPFDLVTFNLLQMLDTLDQFVTVPAGVGRIRLDPAEAPVLQPYAVRIVEEALARYGQKYGLQPRGPVLVEIFPKHDHFAVRTLGIPGLLGALGACFGRVVTQDSPRARPPNTFNWQATLWHELAHVFTLQLSDYRVPRWLSEGISVYEEGRVRPEWAGDSEMTFARVYAAGNLPKLVDFNAAFTRPDLVAAAYFQASLVVGLLVERHGEAVLRTLMSAYAAGASTEEALRKATGAGLSDLQSAFDAMVRERYGDAARALETPKNVEIPRSAPAAALVEIADRHANSFPVQMAAGGAMAAAGAHAEAIAAFERAARLVPFARGDDSPRAHLARLALAGGDTARAASELEALVRHDHANVDAARQLASLAEKAGNEPLRLLAYERIVEVDPFDAAAHAALGRIAMGRRDAALAVREFQAALAAGPVDRVAAHCDLAEAYLLGGRSADARREAVAALEIAPTFERAQELLLKTTEGK